MLSVVALLLAVGAFAAIDSDEVKSLPGIAKLSSKLYSGYLDVGGGRQYHYMLSLSQNDSSSDPVLMFMNGGPGCSSLDGFFTEGGPYRVDNDNHSMLHENEHSFTKFSSYLALESPGGVGFSTNPDHIGFNDSTTAEDNFQALVQFFKGFPELADLDFYISGESYAGVYIPTLAARVLSGNSAGESKIRLKGLLVGNGCTGTEVGACSGMGDYYRSRYMWRKDLYPTALYEALNASCGADWEHPSAQCKADLKEVAKSVGDVNIYDLSAPCINDWSDDDDSSMALGEEMDGEGMSMFEKGLSASGVRLDAYFGQVTGPVSCIDAGPIHHYLNQMVVVEALHVQSGQKEWKEWTICALGLHYTPTAKDLPKEVYPTLLDAGLRVLIYGGSSDLCVVNEATEEWTEGMDLPVQQPWTPYNAQGQLRFYLTKYNATSHNPKATFSFASVLASGHEVPQYTPIAAYSLFRKHIQDRL